MSAIGGNQPPDPSIRTGLMDSAAMLEHVRTEKKDPDSEGTLEKALKLLEPKEFGDRVRTQGGNKIKKGAFLATVGATLSGILPSIGAVLGFAALASNPVGWAIFGIGLLTIGMGVHQARRERIDDDGNVVKKLTMKEMGMEALKGFGGGLLVGGTFNLLKMSVLGIGHSIQFVTNFPGLENNVGKDFITAMLSNQKTGLWLVIGSAALIRSACDATDLFKDDKEIKAMAIRAKTTEMKPLNTKSTADLSIEASEAKERENLELRAEDAKRS